MTYARGAQKRRAFKHLAKNRVSLVHTFLLLEKSNSVHNTIALPPVSPCSSYISLFILFAVSHGRRGVHFHQYRDLPPLCCPLVLPKMTLPALPKLSTALLAKKKQVLDSMPEETVKGIAETSAALAKVYTPKPLAKGDVAPDFTLNNASGEPVTLSHLLRTHSAVVLTWYRGGWCPYCNVALESLIAANEHIEALGAKLVALTPETPDESMSVIERAHIPFHVLSDDGLFVAHKYGIAFTVTDEIKALYRTFGVDLDHMNGNDGNRKARLPLPAAFVLDKHAKVTFVYANLDYTTRAEPTDIVDAIKRITE